MGVTGSRATVPVKYLNTIKTEISSKVSVILESLNGQSHVTVDQAFTMTELN